MVKTELARTFMLRGTLAEAAQTVLRTIEWSHRASQAPRTSLEGRIDAYSIEDRPRKVEHKVAEDGTRSCCETEG